MFRPHSLWGLTAFLLGVAGLLLASLVGNRDLTKTFAALGLVVAFLGLAATLKNRTTNNWVWLGLGGTLSGAVLLLALFVPGLLNMDWVRNVPVPDLDPTPLRIARDRLADKGSPLAAEAWVDAATEGIRQADVELFVKSATAATVPGQLKPCLQIHFLLHQIRPSRRITFEGFARDKHLPCLTDDAGQSYAFLGHQPRRFAAAFDLMPLTLDHLLFFELPSVQTESLKLTLPTSAWGGQGVYRFHIKTIVREAPPEPAKVIAQYKRLVRNPSGKAPDAALGRALFFKHCQECHTLFGVGGKTGPDLTDRGQTPDGRPKRGDLDFLLTSIIDPSAEIAKGFEPWVVTTTSGRFITGIKKEENADTVTLQTAGQKMVVPKKDIEDMQPSKVSIMPTGLLQPLADHEVRSLVAYVSGPGQVPLLATPDNASHLFFNGSDLSSWHSDQAKWKVDNGEIVASGPQGGKPALLTSNLLVEGDFHLTFRFRSGNGGRGAILLRGEDKLGQVPAGARVELTAGGKVVLVGSEGRPASPVEPAASASNNLQADSWNKLEIFVTGKRLQVRLQGREVATLADARLPVRRSIALEAPGDSRQEIRFRNLDLQLLLAKK